MGQVGSLEWSEWPNPGDEGLFETREVWVSGSV